MSCDSNKKTAVAIKNDGKGAVMKRLNTVIMLTGILVIACCTGAFAAEAQDDAAKPDTGQVETKKTPQGEIKKPAPPRDPSQQAARMQARQEKEKVIREFMNEFRAAERKFNQDKKAASKLPPDERKAAGTKAAQDFEASIEKAEQTRDAALEKIDPDRKKHKKKKKDRDKRRKERERKKAANTVKSAAEPIEVQTDPDTKNAEDKK
jgi:hypothetical protein